MLFGEKLSPVGSVVLFQSTEEKCAAVPFRTTKSGVMHEKITAGPASTVGKGSTTAIPVIIVSQLFKLTALTT